MAPENGSQQPTGDWSTHPRHAETPALAGVSLARPEGLEPPTF